ncbi:hypothetical protein FE257_011461 [Aspergillus nanangensis]|uniref:Zn(2)-C6 fungal-type domain-containing protein n=1 Tax=Aspergillus nanangensis TaxID=2582783 RepID=A0AAD4CH77_ASPNN|nr:hypothetical protein FE257_011461 [Aspergillus nanangensis]
MALRRPHRKSRHGCAECKKRRVKCDELRPVCSNCSKRYSECHYEAASSLLWTNEDAPSRSSAKSGSEGPQSAHSSFSTSNSFGVLNQLSGPDAASQPIPSLNLGDLELMMQWCNSTHQTFSRNERVDPIWRVHVPEEALSHPFLMHGILALSALQIARTRDGDRRPAYISTAVAHQNQALAIFRESLSDINESNAKAMFGFASIVVVYALGFPHSPDSKDPRACLDDLLQVFTLSRGVQQVLAQATPWIQGTNWEVITHLDDYDKALQEEESLALHRLREVNQANSTRDPAHDLSVFEAILDHLEDMTAAIHGGLNSTTAACRWAIKMTPRYGELIREHNPLALVILAHYFAILYRLHPDWCVYDWCVRVPKALWLILDDDWRPLVHWPMAAVYGDNDTHERDASGLK